MTTFMTCRICKGSGFEEEPPAFYGEGENPEAGIKCSYCDGSGQVEVHNPAGIRIAYLIAQMIVKEYPHNKVDGIYEAIVVNISNAADAFSEDTYNLFGDMDGNLLFSEGQLPQDAALKRVIDKSQLFNDAKAIVLPQPN